MYVGAGVCRDKFMEVGVCRAMYEEEDVGIQRERGI